jgi:hypothetical protein
MSELFDVRGLSPTWARTQLTLSGHCRAAGRLTTLDAVRVGDHLETMFVLDACRVCLAAEPFERDETNGVLFCRECGSPAA